MIDLYLVFTIYPKEIIFERHNDACYVELGVFK